MFGTVVSSRPGVALSLEQGESSAKPPTDPSAGIYSHVDSDDSPRPDELKVSHTLSSCECIVPHRKFPVTKVPPGVFSTDALAGEGEERQVWPG